MPPCLIAHFFFGLAVTVGVTVAFTGAAVDDPLQSIRSSSSSSTSNDGTERPIGFDCRPCAHGSVVMLAVLPAQSIDGVGATVNGTGGAAAAFDDDCFVAVDVVLVDVVVGVELPVVVVVDGADVSGVVGVEVAEDVDVVVVPDVTTFEVVVTLSTDVPPLLPACGSRGPPCWLCAAPSCCVTRPSSPNGSPCRAELPLPVPLAPVVTRV